MAPASAAIPPALPPSVEEAYRRKCLQLKQRTNEVEEANDAARLRLGRLKRQVEKLRLERALLLEQLTKRTSTNVEDSEGSASPPPTPKEKPLRTKRGHRKPSLIANLESGNLPGATFINQNVQTLSPSSDAFSRSNGMDKPPKKPSNAFELYCHDNRSSIPKDEGANVEEELARGWKDLPQNDKEEYQLRHDRELDQYQKEKDAYAQKAKAEAKSEQPADSQAEDTPARDDEDIVMEGGNNYDTETQTPGGDAED